MKTFDGSGVFKTSDSWQPESERSKFTRLALYLSITTELAGVIKRDKTTASEVAFEMKRYLELPSEPVVLSIDRAIQCPDLAKEILRELDSEIPF